MPVLAKANLLPVGAFTEVDMFPKNLTSTLKFVAPIVAALLTTGVQAQSGYHLLHSFYGQPSENPSTALVADAQGNLYGTAVTNNGCPPVHCGSVFQVSKNSDGGWSTTTI